MQLVQWNEKTLRDRCEEVGECWIWAQACNGQGYPQARINGKSGQMVRRWVYLELMGKPIPLRHIVTSSCRDPKCCNPAHLQLMSCSKRMALTHKVGHRMGGAEYVKRTRHFEHNGHVRLNMDIARKIRARTDERAEDLAEEYKVAATHIRAIWRGVTWREVSNSSVFNWRP